MTDRSGQSRRHAPDRRLPFDAVLMFVFCGLTLAIAIRMTGYYDLRETSTAITRVPERLGPIVGSVR